MELALDKGQGGEAYFITDDEYISVRALVNQMLASTGRSAPNKNVGYGFARTVAWGIEGVWKMLGIKKQPRRRTGNDW